MMLDEEFKIYLKFASDLVNIYPSQEASDRANRWYL